jgi:DNA end-binding protein Ku
MAEALIASMTGEFDPTEFTDDYREAMTALLEAKQSGGEVAQVPEVEDTGGAVVDLMSALRRSVERARGGSADDVVDDSDDATADDATADEAPAAEKKAPARKAPAKKAPAKKAAPAKKDEAEKPAAKKTTPAKKSTTADKPPAKRARRSA